MSLNPTPGLPEFEYIKPASLDEASRFLAAHPDTARPFLGGTDTFVRMRDGVWKDRYLVDVKHLAGMDDLVFNPQTGLTIGAAVNMNRVIRSDVVNQHYPLLAQAAQTVAGYQLRTRATIVGNVCNASPAGDTIGACLALNGRLRVFGAGKTREEPLSSFFIGPGKTTLQKGDIVTAVSFPAPPPNAVGQYIKLNRNNMGDLSIVGVTVFGYPDGDTASGYRFRLALASVAPVPLVPAAAEAILARQPITEETIAQAAQAAMDAASPISDTRGSAEYRKMMVRNLTAKGITAVWRKLNA